MKGADLLFDNVSFSRGDFSLSVDAGFPAGKLSVILGPSGCGKTTLLDLAAGFLHPVEGRILEGRQEVTNLPPEKRRVGVVFQDHALFPHMTLKKNIMFGLLSRGIDKKEAAERAEGLLEMVKLKRFARRRPASLSGGEKQRVALARALAIEPDILLLDEPFSALDASLRREMRAEVRQIQQDTGITTILVTHDQEEALAMADNLAIMDRGRIVRTGCPEELWNRPSDLFAAQFLGRSTRLSVRNATRLPNRRLKLETPAGSLEISAGDDIPAEPLVMIVRPDRMVLESGGPLEGIVTGSEYAGGYWRLVLEIPGAPRGDEVLLETRDEPVPAPGEKIRFRPQESGIILLGAGSA